MGRERCRWCQTGRCAYVASGPTSQSGKHLFSLHTFLFSRLHHSLMTVIQDELYSTDSDGELHYSLEAILNGDVVLPMQGEARDYGYWGTLPANPTRDSMIYPNPLMVKFTRELWSRYSLSLPFIPTAR